jgi:hypothetical protein
MRIRLATLTVLLVAAAIAAAPAPARTAKASACSDGTTAKTSSYVLALKLGPRQEMYMPSEVQARKLKTGQVMLGGAMAMIDKVPAGMKIYDLAVHVCTKSGAVVTQLKPVILVKQGAKTTNVPVAMMAGVGKGLSDYHYGNDVLLKPGTAVTVTVTVNGQRAVLTAKAPASGAGMGMAMG